MLDLDEAGRPGTLHRNPAGRDGHPLADAVRLAVLPPDGAGGSRPRRSRSAAVRPVVRRERGLRAVGPAAVGPPGCEPHRAARAQAGASRAGLAAPRRAAGVVSARDRAARDRTRRARISSSEQAELAWGLGSGRKIARDAADPYLAVLGAFEDHYGVDARCVPLPRECSSRRARHGRRSSSGRRKPRGSPCVGASRRLQTRRAHDRASSWSTALDGPPAAVRVAVVSPEPTPYRSPLFDRVAARPEVDLTVIYAAETVANRTWTVEPEHRAEFLCGDGASRASTACFATTTR